MLLRVAVAASFSFSFSFSLLSLIALGCGADTSITNREPLAAPPSSDPSPPPTLPTPSAFAPPTFFLERDAGTIGDSIYWSRKSGVRSMLALGSDRKSGTLTDEEGGNANGVDHVSFEQTPEGEWLRFREPLESREARWYRLRVVGGVAAGRSAMSALEQTETPPPLTAFDHHVTGWSAEVFALAAARALSWSVTLADGRYARIHIAKTRSNDAWTGQLKIYAGRGAVAVG